MDKLNLTPQERRLVAGVGLIVFVFLNIWLVWPHFRDRNKIQSDREKAEQTLARYQREVDRLKLYQAKVRDLENQGSRVETEEQDVKLAEEVLTQSHASKLDITDNRDVRSSSTQTNQFFDEKARKIQYRGDTEALVSFLTNLTQASSLIRVKDLTVRPDPANAPTRLSGEITLVASYQRKAPLKATAVASSATIAPPPKTPVPNATTKVAATATKTNVVTKPSSGSKQGPGLHVVTNQPLPGANTNKTAIPRTKPLLAPPPKS